MQAAAAPTPGSIMVGGVATAAAQPVRPPMSGGAAAPSGNLPVPMMSTLARAAAPGGSAPVAMTAGAYAPAVQQRAASRPQAPRGPASHYSHAARALPHASALHVPTSQTPGAGGAGVLGASDQSMAGKRPHSPTVAGAAMPQRTFAAVSGISPINEAFCSMPPTVPQDEAHRRALQLVTQHAQMQQGQHALARPTVQRPRLPHAIPGLAAVRPGGPTLLPHRPAAAAARAMRPAVPAQAPPAAAHAMLPGHGLVAPRPNVAGAQPGMAAPGAAAATPASAHAQPAQQQPKLPTHTTDL
jgi:hypothetical protein